MSLKVMPAQSQALEIQERDRLEKLEVKISSNLKAFYEVGRALSEIRDSRLYRETHKTFEEYCRDRWDLGKPQAHRLICASNVVENLVPIGTTPQTESQARPLTKLEPEQQVQAWQQAVETAPGGKVTAKHVKEIVNEITGEVTQVRNQSRGGDENEMDMNERPPEGEVAMRYARMAVMQLKGIHHSHHDREEAFDFVQQWITQNR